MGNQICQLFVRFVMFLLLGMKIVARGATPKSRKRCAETTPLLLQFYFKKQVLHNTAVHVSAILPAEESFAIKRLPENSR
jgi:hypothetical protein